MITRLLNLGVNHLLSLSNCNADDLLPLRDKTIEIIINHFPCRLYFTFNENTVSVSTTTTRSVNTTISGLPFSFIAALKKQSFSQSGIRIHGEIETAESLKNFINHIDIDCEEKLSRLTGDSVAHYMFSSAKCILNTTKKIAKNVCDTWGETITEEKQWVVSENELELFYEEVSDLHFSVDHLSIQLQHLQKRSPR